MEQNLRKLGGSLKVPIVQELAKEVTDAIPPRYVRLDQQHNNPIFTNPSDIELIHDIPVIEMQRLSETNFMDSELEKLHSACKEWGFFQVINHGVNHQVIDKMKSEIKGFFDLTLEEKMKFSQEPGDVEGYGQVFVVSEEQKLDWADLFYIVTLPKYLRKPHLIPKLHDTFRKAIEEYAAELKLLAVKILTLMAKAVRMKIDDIEALFEEGWQGMRMNYYPPCPKPELVTGLCPHSDAVGLTILLQVNEIQGLQIKKDGVWIPISPLPDALIVNIGDIMEIVTNGIYRSVEHRATVNSEKHRISIATFLSPKMEGDLGPAPSLVTPQSPAKFRRIGVADYFRGYFSKELKGKSYVDEMRI